MKKNHSRLSARSKHLWGAAGLSLFVIANIMLFNDTLSRALLMFMWLLTLRGLPTGRQGAPSPADYPRGIGDDQ